MRRFCLLSIFGAVLAIAGSPSTAYAIPSEGCRVYEDGCHTLFNVSESGQESISWECHDGETGWSLVPRGTAAEMCPRVIG